MTCYETYKVENLVSSSDNCWCQNILIYKHTVNSNLIMLLFSFVLLNTDMFQVQYSRICFIKCKLKLIYKSAYHKQKR